MIPRPIAFITGLHRSGTSPLARILAAHPRISGFSGTGVPEDEGQHLQRVVRPAKAFGGPGRFALDAASYLDETSPLATAANAAEIWNSWSPWWDLSRPVLLEKTPTTLVRTRFFQALFPGSKFVVIIRHPLIVAKATIRFGKAGLTELVLNWCFAMEALLADLPHLGENALLLRYEDAQSRPHGFILPVLEFLGVEPVPLPPFEDHNAKYEILSSEIAGIPVAALSRRFGDIFERFGYRLDASGGS